MPAETLQHRELKRLSLVWAQAQGYAIAEVSVPCFRARLDVAANLGTVDLTRSG